MFSVSKCSKTVISTSKQIVAKSSTLKRLYEVVNRHDEFLGGGGGGGLADECEEEDWGSLFCEGDSSVFGIVLVLGFMLEREN